MAQVKRSDIMTLGGSLHWDYSVPCASYSIVLPCGVRVQAAAVDYLKKVIGNICLAPIVVLYQDDWAPSLQAASFLEIHAVPLGIL